MGMIALCDIRDDCVILDVGGTTTDIAVFADGSPVIEEHGIPWARIRPWSAP
jgi:N-methylhydantoinase A/oxoprolinase/acetone carboxylase beta subunit